MIHVECPWCTEPVVLESASLDLACETCGIVVEVAADRIAEGLPRAA
jgi:ribosomal protein S27E